MSNLAKEGITQHVYNVGDVRVSTCLDAFVPKAKERQGSLFRELDLGADGRSLSRPSIARPTPTIPPS